MAISATTGYALQPGLIARYQLTDFLRAMADTASDDRAAAVFLLVPGHDTGGIPRIISGTRAAMTIPGILPGHALRVPPTWIARETAASADVT